MNETYTKEVVDLKLEQLNETMCRLNDTLLERCNDILVVAKDGRDQAKITNGRVNALEKINENRAGANRILTWLGVPVMSFLIGYLSWIGIQVTSIERTLSAYEITITR